jgi:hypothetical protein
MVAMDQLRSADPYFYQRLSGGVRKNLPRTFAINKRQPIRSYMVITQSVHSGNVRQWRDPIMLSWREGLVANPVFVVDIQKARDDRGDTTRRCGLRKI